MTNIDFDNMNKAIKTGELKKMLAAEEIKNNRNFTPLEIKRAIKETNVNNFTRNDINFEKALQLDLQYQSLQTQTSILCDVIKDIQEDKKKEYKEKLLDIVEQKDRAYKEIQERFI